MDNVYDVVVEPRLVTTDVGRMVSDLVDGRANRSREAYLILRGRRRWVLAIGE